MRQASRAALRVLIRDKKLVQYTAGQASLVTHRPASRQAAALAVANMLRSLSAAVNLVLSPLDALNRCTLSINFPLYCCHCACATPCPWPLPLVQVGQLELTHKGRAMYDSALPLDAAMQLFESCLHAEDGERDNGALDPAASSDGHLGCRQ